MGNILLVPSTANAALHAAFHAGLANCYAQFRGDAAVSVPEAADGVHLLVAIDVRGTPRGGFRLHLCRDTDPPPMVHALAARPEICGAILDKGGKYLAEPRALWVHPDERGSGLGARLTRAVIAVAPLLGADRLVILSHQYLDRYHAEVGFLIDAGMGEHAYPDPRFHSKVFWCDPVTLVGASSQARRDILRMRTLFSQQGTVPWGPMPPRRSSGRQSPGLVEKTCLITRGSIVMSKPNQQFRPFQHLVRKDQAQPLGNGIFFREAPVTAAVPTPAASDELLTALDTSATSFGRQIALYAGEQDVTALLQIAVLPAESSDFARLAGASPADLDKSALLTSLAGQERAQLAPLLYVALRRARLEDRHTVVTYVRAGATLLQDVLGLVPLTRLSPVVSPTGETYLPYGQRLDIALERAFAAAEGAGHRFPSTFLMDEITESVERWIIDLWKTRWFQAIYDGTLTREQYVYSSAQVYQFVRWTTRILARCVASSHDKELRNHFLGHLQGEINHEVIIERDLAYLGEDVEFMMQKMVPNGPTGMFMAVQESIIGFRNDPLLLMASPLAAEGIAAHLDQTFMDCLRDVVRSWGVEKPEKATMFWSSHINTDGGESGHWQTTIDMVGQRLKTESDVARFLSVCHMSMAALTMAYDSYVDDMKVFGAEAPAQKSVAAALQAS